MNYDYKQTDLSRSVLGGLFSGLVATILNVLFILIYRSITQYYGFDALDITTTVFGSVLLSIALGVMFYFFVHYMKKGIPFYRVVVLIVTALIIYLGITLRYTVESEITIEFRVLVVGTQAIIGVLAAFLIPYLFRHDTLIS